MSKVIDFKRISDKQKEGLVKIIDTIDFDNAGVMMVINFDLSDENGEFMIITNYDEPGMAEMYALGVITDHLANKIWEVDET